MSTSPPTTTVIGSYPLEINNHVLIQSYFENQTIPSWNQYITQAVQDMIQAGITLISDGQTRDPFINIFARKLQGFQIRDRVTVIDKIQFTSSITASDLSFVRSFLPKNTKLLGLIVGPHTLSKSVANSYYSSDEDLAFDIAEALRLEALAIQPYVDMISIDEPFYANEFPSYAYDLISHIIRPIHCPTRLHACGDVSKIVPQLLDLPVNVLSHEFCASPGLYVPFKEHDDGKKQFCVGVVRSDQTIVESKNQIMAHIQKASDVFGSRLYQIAPDCGLRLLPRKIAYQKLSNIVEAVHEVYD